MRRVFTARPFGDHWADFLAQVERLGQRIGAVEWPRIEPSALAYYFARARMIDDGVTCFLPEALPLSRPERVTLFFQGLLFRGYTSAAVLAATDWDTEATRTRGAAICAALEICEAAAQTAKTTAPERAAVQPANEILAKWFVSVDRMRINPAYLALDAVWNWLAGLWASRELLRRGQAHTGDFAVIMLALIRDAGESLPQSIIEPAHDRALKALREAARLPSDLQRALAHAGRVWWRDDDRDTTPRLEDEKSAAGAHHEWDVQLLETAGALATDTRDALHVLATALTGRLGVGLAVANDVRDTLRKASIRAGSFAEARVADGDLEAADHASPKVEPLFLDAGNTPPAEQAKAAKRESRQRAQLEKLCLNFREFERVADPYPDVEEVLARVIREHPEWREGLEFALDRRSDEEIARSAGVSRRTIIRRRQAVADRLAQWADAPNSRPSPAEQEAQNDQAKPPSLDHPN
jgi:hypothetical protein